jgi:hypothetical protein
VNHNSRLAKEERGGIKKNLKVPEIFLRIRTENEPEQNLQIPIPDRCGDLSTSVRRMHMVMNDRRRGPGPVSPWIRPAPPRTCPACLDPTYTIVVESPLDEGVLPHACRRPDQVNTGALLDGSDRCGRSDAPPCHPFGPTRHCCRKHQSPAHWHMRAPLTMLAPASPTRHIRL